MSEGVKMMMIDTFRLLEKGQGISKGRVLIRHNFFGSLCVDDQARDAWRRWVEIKVQWALKFVVKQGISS